MNPMDFTHTHTTLPHTIPHHPHIQIDICAREKSLTQFQLDFHFISIGIHRRTVIYANTMFVRKLEHVIQMNEMVSKFRKIIPLISNRTDFKIWTEKIF